MPGDLDPLLAACADQLRGPRADTAYIAGRIKQMLDT
jgi:hypothetical protein